ncbi:uncharacterized protein LOC132402137 isoform X2 [Hypanus sabinus]|uniref:uncharacterized protein LOC132402137 isoform X2 n=1 Tax=Hypanus sabinus TaxID=79690 RepID=UPI0028C4BC60|nr:uncharacterized protein LOC132402137 isoform X2 [Hypanus sabinus]
MVGTTGVKCLTSLPTVPRPGCNIKCMCRTAEMGSDGSSEVSLAASAGKMQRLKSHTLEGEIARWLETERRESKHAETRLRNGLHDLEEARFYCINRMTKEQRRVQRDLTTIKNGYSKKKVVSSFGRLCPDTNTAVKESPDFSNKVSLIKPPAKDGSFILASERISFTTKQEMLEIQGTHTKCWRNPASQAASMEKSTVDVLGRDPEEVSLPALHFNCNIELFSLLVKIQCRVILGCFCFVLSLHWVSSLISDQFCFSFICTITIVLLFVYGKSFMLLFMFDTKLFSESLIATIVIPFSDVICTFYSQVVCLSMNLNVVRSLFFPFLFPITSFKKP